jgi:thiamine kinase-like enzyme
MDNDEKLMGGVSFDGLEPGSYETSALFAASAIPKINALSIRKSLADSEITSRGFGGQRKLSATFNVPVKEDLDQGSLRSISDESVQKGIGEESLMDIEAEEKRTSMFGRKLDDRREKTPQIVKLEKILSQTYNAPELSITNIEDLPVTRKQVRRVSFTMKDSVYQIWVFKADSKTIFKELTSYYIAHKNGIPTAKPIGFVPKEGSKSYPYELAILGGVVEHAGEPYNQLISKLSMDGDCIFKTASSIARLIADFHYKLTKSGNEFKKYGIKLDRADPREEIKQRILPALKLKEGDVEGLMDACGELYEKQRGELVISHGDINTRNIVTISSIDTTMGQPRTSLSKFGIIDFGSLMYDYPEGDLSDFWLHHLRDAYWASNGTYHFSYDNFEGAYLERMVELNGKAVSNGKNRIISSALWNLYEMFDPLRKDGLDIQQKARFHAQLLRNDLLALAKEGDNIGRELKKVLSRTQYADVW